MRSWYLFPGSLPTTRLPWGSCFVLQKATVLVGQRLCMMVSLGPSKVTIFLPLQAWSSNSSYVVISPFSFLKSGYTKKLLVSLVNSLELCHLFFAGHIIIFFFCKTVLFLLELICDLIFPLELINSTQIPLIVYL